jgi:hypothetical protein
VRYSSCGEHRAYSLLAATGTLRFWHDGEASTRQAIHRGGFGSVIELATANRRSVDARVRNSRVTAGRGCCGDVGAKPGVAQKLLDECAKDLLSGDARESEAVSGFSLPDVEGSVCGGGEVHRPLCPLAACWMVEFLTDVREAFAWRRTVGMRGWFGAERRGAGFDAAEANHWWISVDQDSFGASPYIRT